MRLQRTRGHCRLTVRSRTDGSNEIHTLFQEGAARLRTPSRSPDEPVEAVLINTAGGVTGGDILQTDVRVETGANAVVSGQACEKIYRSVGGDASLATRITVGTAAEFAWLPQPTILFDRARLRRCTEVEVSRDGVFLGLESIVFGRHAMGETVAAGAVLESWRIRIDGELRIADELRVEGAIDEILSSPALLESARALATVYYVAPDASARLDEARALLNAWVRGRPGRLGAATHVDGALMVRMLAPGGQSLTRGLTHWVEGFRGCPMPRVWKC